MPSRKVKNAKSVESSSPSQPAVHAFGSQATLRCPTKIDVWWEGEQTWSACVIEHRGLRPDSATSPASSPSSLLKDRTKVVTVKYVDQAQNHVHELEQLPGPAPAAATGPPHNMACQWRPHQDHVFGFRGGMRGGEYVRVFWGQGSQWRLAVVESVLKASGEDTREETQLGKVKYLDDNTTVVHDFSLELWHPCDWEGAALPFEHRKFPDVHQRTPGTAAPAPAPSRRSPSGPRRQSNTAAAATTPGATTPTATTPGATTPGTRKRAAKSSSPAPRRSPRLSRHKSTADADAATESPSTGRAGGRSKRGGAVSTRTTRAALASKQSTATSASAESASDVGAGGATNNVVTGRRRDTEDIKFLQAAIAAAKNVFHPNAVAAPGVMPGREAEHKQLREFVATCLRGRGQGNNIYLGGRPGTGKTATVKKVCNDVLKVQLSQAASSPQTKKPKGTRSVTIVEVNSARDVIRPNDIFPQIVRALQSHGARIRSPQPGSGAAGAKAQLERFFCGAPPIIPLPPGRRKSNGKSRGMVILVIDELENLLGASRAGAANNGVLHSLFEWAKRRGSRLVLIGISNEIELIEQHLPHLRTSGIAPELLLFRPYSEAQLADIIAARIEQFQTALQLSVADAHNGNGRRGRPRRKRVTRGSIKKEGGGDNAIPEPLAVAFAPTAIQLCCRKVAGLSGDARKSLGLFWKATDRSLHLFLEDSQSAEPTTRKFEVNVHSMHTVLRDTFQSKHSAQIAGLPSKARILLAVFAGFVQEHNREGGDSAAAASREKRKKPGVHAGATTASLFSRYVQVCEQCLHQDRSDIGGMKEFSQLMSTLKDGGFVSESNGKGSSHRKRRPGHKGSSAASRLQLAIPLADIAAVLESHSACKAILSRSMDMSKQSSRRGAARRKKHRPRDAFDPATTDSRLQDDPSKYSYHNDGQEDDEDEL